MMRRAGMFVFLFGWALVVNGYSQPALKQVFQDRFRVGAALNAAQFTGQAAGDTAIVQRHFNTITPENVLKWERVHPEPDRYDFELPDKYVEFGQKNKMFIVGHALVWHHQTPAWVFQDADGKTIGREALLKRMRDHIHTVVGRYKGRIHGWDVVNEALEEDGSLRQSQWMKIIGEDYIPKAFQFAHEADPKVELYYNDYSLENEPKRKGAVNLIKKLQAQGIKVTAVGIQGHDHLEWPSPELEDATIAEFAKLGIKVAITEFDIDVLPRIADAGSADLNLTVEEKAQLNPYTKGLPDSVQQQLAEKYASLFRVFLKHRGVLDRVTFWGVTDRDSWLNGWPVRGRTSYPLLFDREGKPKPAFDSVVRSATREGSSN